MFILICAPLVPGKRPGCGYEHTSLTYAIRGLLNIPYCSYKTHLPMWIGGEKKPIRFANVKYLLLIINKGCFVKIGGKCLCILMGIYCKNSRISPKLEVFPAHIWLIPLNLHQGMTWLHDSALASLCIQAGVWLPPFCAASWLRTRVQSFHLSHLQRTVCSSE